MVNVSLTQCKIEFSSLAHVQLIIPFLSQNTGYEAEYMCVYLLSMLDTLYKVIHTQLPCQDIDSCQLSVNF